MKRAPALARSVAGLIAVLAVSLPAAGHAAMDATTQPPFFEDKLQSASHRAVASWNAENPWRYSTDFLFALTRGAAAADMHVAARVTVGVLVAPFDLAYLPFAALAGLFGD
ncbi:MAG: hypothetical protein O7A09_12795 [Proteobacteria bacterium]|nr:hypothetical protein [Pseudomonadota bacterium]